MSAEILKHLAAAADAAGEKLTEAEAAGTDAARLLDHLTAASTSAARSLPPDPSVKVLRRYVDADGHAKVELELDLDDDLVEHLDMLPDRDAFIEEALRRKLNEHTLGRHGYHRQLTAAAREYGLQVSWGADLDLWMDHYPQPPDRLTAEILTAHAQWVSSRPSHHAAGTR